MRMMMTMTRFRYCKLTSVITQLFLSYRQHSALLFCSSINTHTSSRLEISVHLFRSSVQGGVKCSLFIPPCSVNGKGLLSIRTSMEFYIFKNKYVRFSIYDFF